MLYEVPLGRTNEVAGAAADAFIGAGDPIGNFVFRDEPDHLAIKRRFYESLVLSCSPGVVIHGTSPGLEAVSIWFPPGMETPDDPPPEPFTGQDFKEQKTMEKLQSVNDVIDALTENLSKEPQWYLHLVAVRPQYKERGYASLLVRPMLARAGKEGLSCTLITQSLENTLIYGHWGFKVVREMPVPGSGERFFSMRKD